MNKKHNKATIVLIIIAMFMISISCSTNSTFRSFKREYNPKPVSVTSAGGYFKLKADADIYIQGESEELRKIGNYLAER